MHEFGPETSSRLPAIIGTIAILVSAYFLFWKIKPQHKVLKRGLWGFVLAALLWMGFFIALPTPTARCYFRREMHRRWTLFHGPNMLNYVHNFWDYNPDIILPVTPSGIILRFDAPSKLHIELDREGRSTALHVELDREGRVSIHNAQISLRILSDVLAGRIKRFNKKPTCFLWADKRVEPQQKEQVLALLLEGGCAPVYYVGIRHDHGKKEPEFVATPVLMGNK